MKVEFHLIFNFQVFFSMDKKDIEILWPWFFKFNSDGRNMYRKVSISTREYYIFRALFWSILFSKIRVLFEGRVLFKGGY